MNKNERTELLKRITDILGKYFPVVKPAEDLSVLELFVYGICLENASFAEADEVLAALKHNFFDWNEVRVSSSRELAETMKHLPEPEVTGLRVKRVLQQIFDMKYGFDIDDYRKMSMKQLTEILDKFEDLTPFSADYLLLSVQDRHSLPVSSGEFDVFDLFGMVEAKDREQNSISWLERSIEKKNAMEFFSLFHQLAALYVKNPYGRKFCDIMVEIMPSCKTRLPSRRKTTPDQQRANDAMLHRLAREKSIDETVEKEELELVSSETADQESSATKPASSKAGGKSAKVSKKAAANAEANTEAAGGETSNPAEPSVPVEPSKSEGSQASEPKSAESKKSEKKTVEKKGTDKKAAKAVVTEDAPSADSLPVAESAEEPAKPASRKKTTKSDKTADKPEATGKKVVSRKKNNDLPVIDTVEQPEDNPEEASSESTRTKRKPK